MKRTGPLLTAAVTVTAAGLLTMPLSAAADPTPGRPEGSAQASAVSVSLSPSALLTAVPAVGGILHQALSGAGSAGDLVVRLAGTQAAGSLLPPSADLQQGHAESTALDADLTPLGTELNALQGPLADALTSLHGLLGGTPLAGSPVPQLTSLLPGLTQVQSLLDGLSGALSPDSVLHGLDPRVLETVSARYNVPGSPDAPVADASLADVNLPAGAPLQLQLAPFHARAVSSALAALNHIDAAQSSADNEISTLDLSPKLAALPAGLGSLPDLTGTITGLLNPQTGLPALQSLLGGGTGSPGLLHGLPIVGGSGGQPGLLSAVQTLTSGLGALSPLLAPDGLVGALLGGNVGLNSLVRATDVASNSAVQPVSGGGVQALATTRVGDLQVLPLGASLLRGLLGGLPTDASASLTRALGSLPDLPLLDIKGSNSNVQTALGDGAGSPRGSASFAEVDVLGVPVAGSADALAVAPGSEKDVKVPGTGLELVVSRGLPTVGFDTATHRSMSIAGLELRLLDDGSGPLGGLLSGSTQGTAADQPIATVDLAAAAADIATTPATGVGVSAATAAAPAALTAAQGPTPPQTGSFTGAVPVAGAGLALVAVALEVVPRLTARRRPVRVVRS